VSLSSSSQFRRSGQRDDRRRRVLTDAMKNAASGKAAEVRTRPEPSEAQSEGVSRSERYPEAPLMQDRIRLTDLIPRRLTTFALLLLVGAGLIAGLEFLYAWMPELAPFTTDGRVAAIDLDGEGSLSVWVSSTVLNLAGLVAIIVYTVRRHRTDDYHGRYRVWLWAAMCWFLMSLDETACLHEGFKELMAHWTGTRVFGDGSIWWVAPYVFLFGAVGSRLLMDMLECRLSSLVYLLAGGCYGFAVLAQFNWILPDGGARSVMIEEGAELAGDWLLLMAMGLHARFVILDAEGLLPRRLRRIVVRPLVSPTTALVSSSDRVVAVDEQPDFAETRWDKIDGPHGVPAAVVPPVTTMVNPSLTPTPASWGTSKRKLSRQEKKALRRRLEQMRQERKERLHGE